MTVADDPHSASRLDGDAQEDKLAELLGSYIDRINAGEFIDHRVVASEHPEEASSIVSGLQSLQLLEGTGPLSGPLGNLGDFTLRREIGRGGMGVVYEAWQESVDRQVALKVLPTGIAADNKAFLRFMREAKTAAQLQHPNVVSVYGMGVEDNTPYYSMELVEGETLASLLAVLKDVEPNADTPFGKKDQVGFFASLTNAFADVADGLQHAHSRGVVHRDIKPSNLILAGDGRLRILDFGLARLEGQESLTLSGDLVGTLLYMSPEQARRTRIPVDHRSDVYSFGATLYETLVGHPPFRGKDHSDTLSQIIERDPVEPRKVNPRVPKDLETIVLKCLRKEAGDRYGTAEALEQDLRRFLRGDPIEARPQPTWHLAARRLWRRRLSVALGLTCMLLVAGALFLFAQYSKRERGKRESQYSDLIHEALADLSTMRALDGNPARSVGSDEWWLLTSSPSSPLAGVHEALEEAQALFPEYPEAQYYLALVEATTRRDKEAKDRLSRLSDRPSPFPPAVVLLSELEQGSGAAEADPRAARNVSAPSAAWVAWHRALSHVRRGESAEAVSAFEELFRLTPELETLGVGVELEVSLAYGQALQRAGFELRAIEQLAYVTRNWPELAQPRLLLGLAYRTRNADGDLERAEELFEEAYHLSGRSEWVSSWVATMHAGDPIEAPSHQMERWWERIQDDHVRTRLELRAGIRRGRWRDVILRLEGLGAEDSDEPLYQDLVVWAYAIAWQESGHRPYLERALEAAKRFVKLQPQNGTLWFGLSYVQYFIGNIAEAERAAREAIRVDRRNAGGYNALGWILAFSGRPAEALEILSEGLRAGTGRAQTHTCLGYAYWRLGQLRKARESFLRSIELSATYASAWSALADLELLLGSNEKAVEFARGAVRLSPHALRRHRHLARILWLSGERTKAIEHLEEILELEVDGHELTHRTLARYYVEERQFGAATDHAGRALSLAPAEPEAHEVFVAALASWTTPAASQPVAEALRALTSGQPPKEASEDRGGMVDGDLRTAAHALAGIHATPIEDAAPERALKLTEAIVEASESPFVRSAHAAALFFTGRKSEAIRELERTSRRLPSAPHLHAQLAAYRQAVAPQVLTCASFDGIAEGEEVVLDASWVRGYVEARVLERSGDVASAVVRYRVLLEEPQAAVEALWRLLALDAPIEGEAVRAALESPQIWSEFLHRVRSPVVAPRAASESVLPRSHWKRALAWLESTRPANAHPAEATFLEDIRTILDDLVAGSLRINCGGEEAPVARGGSPWRGDRFFSRGETDTRAVALTLEPPFDRGRRWSHEDPANGYEIPLPPGLYEVTLGFVERFLCDADLDLRRFDVHVEDHTVEGIVPGEEGREKQVFRTRSVHVRDGFLTIRFRPLSENSSIAAIEVRPASQ